MTEEQSKLRDEFAKIALRSLRDDHDRMATAQQLASKNGESTYAFIARHAYYQADAMMEARDAK